MLKCCLEQLSVSWQPSYPSGYLLTHMDFNLFIVWIRQKMPAFYSGNRAVKKRGDHYSVQGIDMLRGFTGRDQQLFIFYFFLATSLSCELDYCQVKCHVLVWKGRNTMSLIVSSTADCRLIFLNFKKTVWLAFSGKYENNRTQLWSTLIAGPWTQLLNLSEIQLMIFANQPNG